MENEAIKNTPEWLAAKRERENKKSTVIFFWQLFRVGFAFWIIQVSFATWGIFAGIVAIFVVLYLASIVIKSDKWDEYCEDSELEAQLRKSRSL